MPVATQVKRRRGTAEENNAFTGAEGEITVDLTNKTLRVHDGETQGGTAVETQRNKSTTISKESTDAQYPSAKAVVDYVSTNSGGAMPVGAIFTTPRTGTIGGAVEANGGEYNIADYSGEGSIGALLTAGSIAYVSKTEFQTQVTNTGACDSFGWNGAGETYYGWGIELNESSSVYTLSENPNVGDPVYNKSIEIVGTVVEVRDAGTNGIFLDITKTDETPSSYQKNTNLNFSTESDPTFLVPKLNPPHIGKTAPVVGNGMSVGMTNGLTNYGLIFGSNAQNANAAAVGASTEAYGKDTGPVTGQVWAPNQAAFGLGVVSDPTKSGMVADLSEATNLRVMVQLATGATDQALETCTSVLSDVSALKEHRVIEFQAPTAANAYTWYRLYSDGWVEQGQHRTTGSDIMVQITLPIEMADTNFVPVIKRAVKPGVGTSANVNFLSANSVTTTGFTTPDFFGGTGITAAWGWEVKGMAAQ